MNVLSWRKQSNIMDNITYTNGAMSEAEVYIMKWIKSIDNNEIFNN